MKKSYKKGFSPLVVIIIIVALAAGGVLVYRENMGMNPVQEITPVSTNTISQIQEGSISSFAIIPSTKDGQPWTMYKKGAKAVLKAKNIASAELWYTPTGTEMKSTFGGTMSKIDQETWELELPENLLTTSFWAEVTDLSGKKIKSVNLGNVGYEEAKPKVSSLGSAGRGDEDGLTCGGRTITVESSESERSSSEYIYSIMVDDKEGVGYPFIGDIAFSHDCKQYAYVAGRNGKQFMVLNGQQLKSYDYVRTPTFSPDSVHFAYVVTTGTYPNSKTSVVVDGVEGKQYQQVQLASNNYSGGFSLNSNHIVYSAVESGKWFLVVDKKEGKKYDRISMLTISVDGKKVTYEATTGSKKENIVETLD